MQQQQTTISTNNQAIVTTNNNNNNKQKKNNLESSEEISFLKRRHSGLGKGGWEGGCRGKALTAELKNF